LSQRLQPGNRWHITINILPSISVVMKARLHMTVHL
jgi:hypothetical protein